MEKETRGLAQHGLNLCPDGHMNVDVPEVSRLVWYGMARKRQGSLKTK